MILIQSSDDSLLAIIKKNAKKSWCRPGRRSGDDWRLLPGRKFFQFRNNLISIDKITNTRMRIRNVRTYTDIIESERSERNVVLSLAFLSYIINIIV